MGNEYLKKILLVEDSLVSIRVMRVALEYNGYKCLIATSAADAIELLKTELPDIILSDYEMPVMNGFEFRTYLIKHKAWKDIPFVFLTSHSDEYLVMQGLNLSAIDYIVKGTPVPVIVSKLNNILSSLRNEHERSINELRTAAEALNARSTPETLPKIEGFKIDFWFQSYQNYPGGDFIDFIKIDDRYCFAVLGDIMGKKWKAWFFTFGFLSYIRSVIRFCVIDQAFTTSQIAERINKLVCLDESLSSILSSMSLLLLDSKTGKIHYTGAGDLPLIKYIAASNTIETITSSGLFLGLQEQGLYDEQGISMASGDKLILLTDGLIDIKMDEGKKSDYPFFAGRITPYLKAANSFNAVKEDIMQSMAGEKQLDDASIIFIEKT